MAHIEGWLAYRDKQAAFATCSAENAYCIVVAFKA